jgi:phytol kinase
VTDPLLALLWVAVLVLGGGAVVLAHLLGLAPTHARDALHVGAGVWVLGWPWWNGVAAPLAIVAAAVVAVGLVPTAAGRVPAVDRFRRSVAEGDEQLLGLILYTVSFALMTGLGLAHRPFPAAAALMALALGDGLGGLLGRRLGRRFYSTGIVKPKTFEGSGAVAVFTAVGVLVSAALFDVEIGARPVLVLALVAASAEGLAPRGTDNIAVPAAVWAVAELLA